MKLPTPARLAARFLACALLAAWLHGCYVYRIDIQQGNEINATMLAELTLGMSKQEVVKTLGSPLVNDPFNHDRWDYYFYLKNGDSGDIEQQSATLLFTDDALSDIKSTFDGG